MKSAKEFKNEVITLLKYCLDETKRVVENDNLEDEELKENESYCEGLKDAIKKIETLSVE